MSDKWKQNPQAVARFEREIVALGRMSLADIIKLKGENLSDGPERFYFMAVYPRSLRALIHENPAGFPWRDVARYGARIADALLYAHSQGFVHRDLKPENILLDSINSPVISDWGLGYFVHKESVVLTALTIGGMGTQYYCCLEQWNTGKSDARGDVYALGMTLAELATGKQNAIRGIGLGLEKHVIPANDVAAAPTPSPPAHPTLPSPPHAQRIHLVSTRR